MVAAGRRPGRRPGFRSAHRGRDRGLGGPYRGEPRPRSPAVAGTLMIPASNDPGAVPSGSPDAPARGGDPGIAEPGDEANWRLPDIPPLARDLAPALQRRIDDKIKPAGALGRLEELAL